MFISRRGERDLSHTSSFIRHNMREQQQQDADKELFARQFNASPTVSSIDPPIPDLWILDPTANPHAGISRLCWGWRSDLEVAVRASDAKSVRKLIQSHSRMDVRIYSECCDLVGKAAARGDLATVKLLIEQVRCDVDGLHFSKHNACKKKNNNNSSINQYPKQFRAIRFNRGYNGCTPLYGASQGEPGADLEQCAAVAKYLLDRGADPMLPNDAGITPLFIAAVNNAFPIVEDMIHTGKCNVHHAIPDGETPLSIVKTTAREYPQYLPLLDLLESAGKDENASATTVNHVEKTLLDEAIKRKKLGNDSFKKREYNNAIDRYGRALEVLKGSNSSESSQVAKIKELSVILHSNQAEAFLKLHAFAMAKKACEEALALDPNHAKSMHRQERAIQAAQQYQVAETRFQKYHQDFLAAAEEHDFVRGADIAMKMKKLAADQLDPYKQVNAMLLHVEMCFHQASLVISLIDVHY